MIEIRDRRRAFFGLLKMRITLVSSGGNDA